LRYYEDMFINSGGGKMREKNRERGGMGPGGYCICPKCNYRKEHVPGVPCREERCPNCGSALIREGSFHHQQIMDKKKKDDKA
jgi:ssDNA-binding Zn-finger/Zn-ribbon topoisomerase 1